MRTTLQPLVVPVDDRPRRSSRSMPATYSPQKVGRHPDHWNGVTWVPWTKPVRPASRGSRLATTLTLTGLALVAITLLTPGFGFALVQWIAIFLAVFGIAAYLRRHFVRAGERDPAR
jgi:hypothetical protein